MSGTILKFIPPGTCERPFRAAAFLDLGLLVAANLLMRTRLPSRKQRPNLQPVNVKKILSDVAYLLLVAGSFLIFWGLFVPFFYLQLFAALHGVRPGLTKYLISIMNASSVFGRTVPNFLADKYGPFNLIIPSTFISGGLVFGMFGTSNAAGAIVFSILYGFFSGGFLSLVTPAAALFAKDLNELGTRVGLLSFVIGFALLTGNPIAGALLSPPYYTWWRPFLFASVVIFIGIFCLVLSRSMLAKRKGTALV